MPAVFGRPAAHARFLCWSRARDAALLTLLAVACATAALTLPLPSSSSLSLPVRALFAAAAVVSLAAANARWGSSRRARAGWDAEVKVARVLERDVGAVVVAHGLLFGRGGDADHVVVTSRGVALVETKFGRGPVAVSGDRVSAGGRSILGEPLRQARSQAAQVRRAIGCDFVLAVVCVSDGVGVVTGDGWAVCGPQQLPDVLASMRGRLPVSAQTMFRERIEQLAA